MKCIQCKKEVDCSSCNFCPACGGTLKDEKTILAVRNFFSRKRNFYIFIIIEVLFIGIFGVLYVNSQLTLNQRNKQIVELVTIPQVEVEWKVREKVLPLTYFGDRKKLIELKVDSPDFAELKVEAEVQGITEKIEKVINIKPESKIYYIEPDITEEGFKNLSESKNGRLKLKVDLVGKDNQVARTLIDDSKDIFFHSRSDMMWKDADGVNNVDYIVRLIDKDREEIKELVRLAANYVSDQGGFSNAMVGPLGGKDEIGPQLKAIFKAIQKDLDIKYIFAPNDYNSVSVQKIKAPDEVIRTKSALCIELVLLVAAALENVGLDAVLVTTNSHAWIGVETASQSGDFIFLELTALDVEPEEAVRIGHEEWNEIKNIPGAYRLTRLNEARAEGLLPIKY